MKLRLAQKLRIEHGMIPTSSRQPISFKPACFSSYDWNNILLYLYRSSRMYKIQSENQEKVEKEHVQKNFKLRPVFE